MKNTALNKACPVWALPVCVFILVMGFQVLTASASEVESINVMGVIEVSSKSTNTIVGVPWVQLGYATNDAIRVCDLVLTNNLTQGDEIKVYNLDARTANQEYNGWRLGASGWESVTMVNANAVNDSPSPEATGVRRGKAFWLTRQNPMEGTKAVPFYLCGQLVFASAESVSIAAGSTGTPVYMLIAPPFTDDYSLDDIAWDRMTIGEQDTISVPLNTDSGAARIYWYDAAKHKWYYTSTVNRRKVAVYDSKIKAGTGFWYISRGGEGKIKW